MSNVLEHGGWLIPDEVEAGSYWNSMYVHTGPDTEFTEPLPFKVDSALAAYLKRGAGVVYEYLKKYAAEARLLYLFSNHESVDAEGYTKLQSQLRVIVFAYKDPELGWVLFKGSAQLITDEIVEVLSPAYEVTDLAEDELKVSPEIMGMFRQPWMMKRLVYRED